MWHQTLTHPNGSQKNRLSSTYTILSGSGGGPGKYVECVPAEDPVLWGASLYPRFSVTDEEHNAGESGEMCIRDRTTAGHSGRPTPLRSLGL